MNSVEKIASNADEKPVHSTTSTKISQTWLASQTGPIAQSISSRGRRPRRSPPASRLQSPAPKSAPPKTAYIVAPARSTTATASALLTRGSPRARPAARRSPGRTGTSSDSVSSASRQRRAIARSVTISATPSTT